MMNEHGGDIYRYGAGLLASVSGSGALTDFSANINPLGMPESVRAAAEEGVLFSEHYPEPDSRSLCRALAGYESQNLLRGADRLTADENIICGNGAAELIYAACRALGPGKGICFAPAFAEYEQALSAAGSYAANVELSSRSGFCVTRECAEQAAGLMAAGEKKPDMLFVCLPNNPTGELIEEGIFDELLDACRRSGTFLFLDACFAELCGGDEAEHCRRMIMRSLEYERCLVLRAFTKIFAMPGLRLGYLLCRGAGIISGIRAQLQPWDVSLPAQSAGLAALRETGFITKSRSYISQEKEYLLRELARLENDGLISGIYGHAANFIFFSSRYQCADGAGLGTALLRDGFLIRDCGNFAGLEDVYYRLAVRTHEENMRLISAMDQIFQKEDGRHA